MTGPDWRAWRVAAACHEAGHALAAVAIGLPLAGAYVRPGRGAVRPDGAAHKRVVARNRRRGLRAPTRAESVAAALALMAFADAGAEALEARERARPGAAWRRCPRIARGPSRGDLRIVFQQSENLRALGVNPSAATTPAADWLAALFEVHAAALWRTAAALHRRKRLAAPDLAALLQPVAADPGPFVALLRLAERLADDPAARWPVPAEAEGARDAAA